MTQTPDPLIIVNPAAGRGRSGKSLQTVHRLLAKSGVNWDWRFTQAEGDAERIARTAAELGTPLVVAMGGDGTIYEVVNGIWGSQTRLGLLPFGTGNDLARSLGLFGNLQFACHTLTAGAVKRLDVGVMQEQGAGKPRRFLVMAGTGYVADVAAAANQGPKCLSGAAAYVWAAVTCLRTFKPFLLHLTVDGVETITKAMFIAIANTPLTGGGMILAPGALMDDGLLEVCLVREVPKHVLLYELLRVFKGQHIRNPAVTMLRGKHVTVDAVPPQLLWVDGDTLGSSPVTYSLLPGALPVMVP